MQNYFRERIRAFEDLEHRLIIADSRLRFATATIQSLRLQRQYFATDRAGTIIREGDTVEILTTTSASVYAGTIATLIKCRKGHGGNCWCTIEIWSGPKSGKYYSRKAKNLRKLITDNDEI